MTTSQPVLQQTTVQAKGFAITALVLGIVAICTAIFGWPGIALGAAAVVFGIVAVKKSQPKGMSVAGIITGSLGLVGGIVVLIIVAMFMSAMGAGIEALETGDLTALEDLGVEFETE